MQQSGKSAEKTKIGDSEQTLTLNKKYLTSKGHHIFIADCGESAMQALNENIFDCMCLMYCSQIYLGSICAEKSVKFLMCPSYFLDASDNFCNQGKKTIRIQKARLKEIIPPSVFFV